MSNEYSNSYPCNFRIQLSHSTPFNFSIKVECVQLFHPYQLYTQLKILNMQDQTPTTPPSKPQPDSKKQRTWTDLSMTLTPDDIYYDHTQVNSNGNFYKVQVFRIGGDAGWIYQWMDDVTYEIMTQRTIFPWR